jgi:cytochrome c5
MRSKHLLLTLVVLIVTPGLTQSTAQDHPPPPPAVKKPAASAHAEQNEDEGERVFQQNCSRCHNAPEGFSSRISGTIVRHMRVRASLSQHDAEELLRFLNP